jgi:hypothetical protein
LDQRDREYALRGMDHLQKKQELPAILHHLKPFSIIKQSNMRSMLYVGATLMIGASIYGFVDYKRSSHSKDFKDMYSTEQKTAPVQPEKIVAEEKTPATSKEKLKTVKTKISTAKSRSQDIVSIVPISAEDKIETSKTSLSEEKTTSLAPSKESSIVKTIKKKRRISSKIFSRAPLRDEEIEVRVPVKEEKKTDKDQ